MFEPATVRKNMKPPWLSAVSEAKDGFAMKSFSRLNYTLSRFITPRKSVTKRITDPIITRREMQPPVAVENWF